MKGWRALGMGALLWGAASGQEPGKPQLRAGVSVKMAVAQHAVEVKAADELDATVVAITAEGKVYLGVTVVEPDGLSKVAAGTVYVKADARAPFQRVLTVLEGLRGKSVVLLAEPGTKVAAGGIMWPHGIRLNVGR